MFALEENYFGLSEVAQRVKVLATKPDNLVQIPGSIWWREVEK